MILHFSLQLFHFKILGTGLDAGLDGQEPDRGQYPIQPIKFVNLVVPSPYEAEPYNNLP